MVLVVISLEILIIFPRLEARPSSNLRFPFVLFEKRLNRDAKLSEIETLRQYWNGTTALKKIFFVNGSTASCFRPVRRIIFSSN